MRAIQLDVAIVGESHYQHNLWRLADPEPSGARVHTQVTALLVAEDDNPHDSNAIAVWIDGLRAGCLARADAARYRPGLLALQQAHGMRVTLAGIIADARAERAGTALRLPAA